MSQHLYCTTHLGQPVEITMGWDRPLQGYFMVVTRLTTAEGAAGGLDEGSEDSEDEGDDAIVYSNLDDPELAVWGGLPPTVDHFRTKLDALGLQVPAAMLEAVERDGWLNVGNHQVVYDADGRVLAKA
jgi:hypothetical protein